MCVCEAEERRKSESVGTIRKDRRRSDADNANALFFQAREIHLTSRVLKISLYVGSISMEMRDEV